MMLDMTFLHTSSKDGLETIYRRTFEQVIDYTQLKGIHTMCTLDNLQRMKEKVAFEAGKLYFLGNGNYHYLTLMLTQFIQEPYTLVVFDHHNDAGIFPFEGLTSCGSWIDDALKQQKLLQEVLIVGVGNHGEKAVSASHFNRLQVLRWENLSQQNFHKAIANIPTDKVYISVDRDVLSRQEVETNWDQGQMLTPELNHFIKEIVDSNDVIAADVCGDSVWDYESVMKDTKHTRAEHSLNSLKAIRHSLFS